MPILKNLLPRMFHRRVILLLAGVGVASSVLGIRMARMASGSDQALMAAESRLVRRQMTPTVRGRILDRLGRVLAQDRPSYDVAVSYAVVSGEWPREQARAFVRKAYREQWSELTADRREELINRAAGVFERHARSGWEIISATSGVSAAEVEKTRDEALGSVIRMHEAIGARRLRSELAAFRSRTGRDPDEPEMASIRRRASAPLREMAQPRVILPRVSDQVAFAFQAMAEEQVELRPLGSDPGSRAVVRVERVPGLRVLDAGDRDYPLDSMVIECDLSSLPIPIRGRGTEPVYLEGVASHVLGWMRPVWQEDEQARRDMLAADPRESGRALLDLAGGGERDRGEYLAGDRVGQSGVEGSMEHHLRGLRGVRTRSVDSGVVEEIPPEPGRDVRVTIDAMLQARVQAAMTPSLGLASVQDWHRSATELPNPTMPTGTPINGAAVVLDIDTGEILAMVSTPPATPRLRRGDPEAAFDDPVNLPHLNRVTDRAYPPGSVVKPLVLVEAVKRGVHTFDQRIECTGHLLPNRPNMLQCWIWKRHKVTHSSQLEHDPDGAEAVMVSCNIFFFTLGRRLGTDGIRALYGDFGVGRTWDLGVGSESPGQAGRGARGPDLELGDAIQMGIGQGPVTWTPLHAACAYAALARGGVMVEPRIIINDPRGGRAGSTRDLALDPAAVRVALEGLRRSVNERLGSGHMLTFHRHGVREEEPIFTTPGVRVIGKTGTATAPDLTVLVPGAEDLVEALPREDESDGVNPSEARRADSRGREVVRSGDHSWFVVLAGLEGENPRYAIAVVMEYAGSGGRVSGPICNQIVKALVSEGYLRPTASVSGMGGDGLPRKAGQ